MTPNPTPDQTPGARRPARRPREAGIDARRRATRLLTALAHAYTASAPFYLHSLAVGPVVDRLDREETR